MDEMIQLVKMIASRKLNQLEKPGGVRVVEGHLSVGHQYLLVEVEVVGDEDHLPKYLKYFP